MYRGDFERIHGRYNILAISDTEDINTVFGWCGQLRRMCDMEISDGFFPISCILRYDEPKTDLRKYVCDLSRIFNAFYVLENDN